MATRVGPQDLGPTPVALRQVAPQGHRAPRLDGLHHPQLLTREAMRGAIGLAVGTKAIGDFGSPPVLASRSAWPHLVPPRRSWGIRVWTALMRVSLITPADAAR
jgi:hypothetical protein